MESVKCVIAGQKPGGVSSSCCGAASVDRGCRVFVEALVGFVRAWRTGWRLFDAVFDSTIAPPEKDLMVGCVEGRGVRVRSDGGGIASWGLQEGIKMLGGAEYLEATW